MHTIATAAHTAYLDVLTGTGYLVGPVLEHTDLWLWPMYDADLRSMLADLERHGWSLDGEELGHAADGRSVRLLCGDAVHDPFADGLDVDALTAADAEFAAASGIDPLALELS